MPARADTRYPARNIDCFVAEWGALVCTVSVELPEPPVTVAGAKLQVVLTDNLGVYHWKPVKQWLAEHLAEIEFFYLPSYSPRLNPDQRLKGDLKQAIDTKVPIGTKANLQSVAVLHMKQSTVSALDRSLHDD